MNMATRKPVEILSFERCKQIAEEKKGIKYTQKPLTKEEAKRLMNPEPPEAA